MRHPRWKSFLRAQATRVGLRLVARGADGSHALGGAAAAQGRGVAVSRALIFDALLESGDFARIVVPLVRLYLAYFTRPPDRDGLEHWLERHHQGATLANIAHCFSQSPEFARRCGALDDDAFVLQAFRSMFGRDPGARKRAPWVDDLASRRVTRGAMIEAFSHSPDFHAHVAAEVCSAVMYLFLLRRTPDPLGFAYWVESRHSGAFTVDRMMRSDEYRERWLANRGEA